MGFFHILTLVDMVDKAKNWWTAGAYLDKLELWRVSTLATMIGTNMT